MMFPSLTARRREIERIRAEHPQLEIILVADSLYARAPLIHLHLLHAKRFSFLLVINARDQKSLFEDIDGRRRGSEPQQKLRGYSGITGPPRLLPQIPCSPQSPESFALALLKNVFVLKLRPLYLKVV
jgi:hypothetical protein